VVAQTQGFWFGDLEKDYFRLKRRSDLRRGAGRGLKDKGVYIIGMIYYLQDFKKGRQGELEKMNNTGGLRGFLQTAGWTLIVFKRGFFGVKEVGGRDQKNKEEQDAQVENPFLLVKHFFYTNRQNTQVQYSRRNLPAMCNLL
jgi:hypothetical protein